MIENKQRPTCKSCARYAGTTKHMRNGKWCVLCRITLTDTALSPGIDSHTCYSENHLFGPLRRHPGDPLIC